MTESADLAAVAASVAATAASLEEFIDRRAQQIAEPAIADAEFKAFDQMSKLGTRHAHEAQRKDDLIAELRRQLDAQVKQNERLHREVKETRGAVRRIEALKVWTNEERKKFVFADELWAALAETGSPAARALAEIQQQRNADA